MKITSTELKLRLGKYLRAAVKAPVFISIRGETENVLMSYSEYVELHNLAKKPMPMEEGCNPPPKD